MIKYVIFFSTFVLIGAQRPPYAGSANRYPQVLPRFKDEQTSTPNIVNENRIGEDSSTPLSIGQTGSQPGQVSAAAAPTGASTTEKLTTNTPSVLPFDELGFGDTVQKVQTWPENQQPFWWVNRHQIAQHLNPVNQQNVVQPGVRTRSFFAG